MEFSYSMPNVGRQREAIERAVQLLALPGQIQNREAILIVRCRKHSVLCRVFRLPAGLLFVPVGKVRGSVLRRHPTNGGGRAVPVWRHPEPYWLDLDSTRSDEVRTRCRCCADVQTIETSDMADHIRRGERTMTLPLR